MPCSACGGGSSSARHFNMKGKFVQPKPQPVNKNIRVTPAQYFFLQQRHLKMLARARSMRRTMRF